MEESIFEEAEFKEPRLPAWYRIIAFFRLYWVLFIFYFFYVFISQEGMPVNARSKILVGLLITAPFFLIGIYNLVQFYFELNRSMRSRTLKGIKIVALIFNLLLVIIGFAKFIHAFSSIEFTLFTLFNISFYIVTILLIAMDTKYIMGYFEMKGSIKYHLD